MLQTLFIEAPAPPVEPLILSSLVTLHLAYTTPSEVTTFLPHIATPKLRRLWVTAHPEAHRQDVESETKELLQTIMAVIPLERLNFLGLKRTPFGDFAPTAPLSLEQMVKSKIPEYDLPLTLQFVRRLKNKKILMHIPDVPPAFRNYLGYPMVINSR
ncbi:hypothetical protein BDZ89DRAFT_1063182 [Hymenopellis radicata]|nr:hypothetical protein BDZ89DRAFT_1063182 [Hymenopellis radicata]